MKFINLASQLLIGRDTDRGPWNGRIPGHRYVRPEVRYHAAADDRPMIGPGREEAIGNPRGLDHTGASPGGVAGARGAFEPRGST